MTKSFAEFVIPKVAFMPTGIISDSDKTYGEKEWFSFQDLSNNYQLLCSWKGQHIPSDNDVTLKGQYGDKKFEENMGKLTANDIGTVKYKHSISRRINDFDKSSYTHETYGYYKLTEHHIANPKEAYILSEMIKDKDNHYEETETQKAWWTTFTGSKSATIPPPTDSALGHEADAFQTYILKLTNGNIKNGSYKYGQNLSNATGINYTEQEYRIVEEDGTEKTGTVIAPEIEYNVKWNEDADQNGVINEADNVTVKWDVNKQEYIVGPFSINYLKDSVKVDGRDFVWSPYQQRDLEEGYDFPNPNEVFHISVKYKPGMTSITGVNFDFEYMNAGGSSDLYEGSYAECTWSVKYKNHYDSEDNFDYRSLWLELTSYVPQDSQDLAHGINGVRWYNYKSLERRLRKLFIYKSKKRNSK